MQRGWEIGNGLMVFCRWLWWCFNHFRIVQILPHAYTYMHRNWNRNRYSSHTQTRTHIYLSIHLQTNLLNKPQKLTLPCHTGNYFAAFKVNCLCLCACKHLHTHIFIFRLETEWSTPKWSTSKFPFEIVIVGCEYVQPT